MLYFTFYSNENISDGVERRRECEAAGRARFQVGFVQLFEIKIVFNLSFIFLVAMIKFGLDFNTLCTTKFTTVAEHVD